MSSPKQFRLWTGDEMLGPFTLDDLVSATGDEVMQYTGLDDANGRSIYEDDVLQSTGKDNRRYVVEFEAPSFVVVRGGTSVTMDRLPISTGIKKIGNVHEHPDLVDKE